MFGQVPTSVATQCPHTHSFFSWLIVGSSSSPTRTWKSTFHWLGIAPAAISVLEALEAQAASRPGISMEESIVERHPDRETATFAVSVRASQASDAPLPQPDALDLYLYQGDESTTW